MAVDEQHFVDPRRQARQPLRQGLLLVQGADQGSDSQAAARNFSQQLRLVCARSVYFMAELQTAPPSATCDKRRQQPANALPHGTLRPELPAGDDDGAGALSGPPRPTRAL